MDQQGGPLALARGVRPYQDVDQVLLVLGLGLLLAPLGGDLAGHVLGLELLTAIRV